MPWLHHLDRVALRDHAIVLPRRGGEALRTRDDRGVELVATFRVGVSRTTDDVLRVLSTMGTQSSDSQAVHERFAPSFSQALEVVARQIDASVVERDRAAFVDRVVRECGTGLGGFHLDDLSITDVNVIGGSAHRG